jgi:hypothetical protein
VLSEQALKKRGFFSPSAVRSIVEGQRTGMSGWSASIWQFLTLELWLRTFVDRAQEDIAAVPMTNLNADAVTYR